jgi:hypothetical protein
LHERAVTDQDAGASKQSEVDVGAISERLHERAVTDQDAGASKQSEVDVGATRA